MATMNSLNNVITNGTNTVTMQGNVVFSGANSVTFTSTGATTLTLPTSGTLATTAQVTGVLPTTVVTGTTQQADINAAYVANNAGVVDVTLPASAVVGSEVQVMNLLGGFSISQAAGQSIMIGDTASTTGTGGSIASSAIGDSLIIKCVVANTTWMAYALQGNLTVV